MMYVFLLFPKELIRIANFIFTANVQKTDIADRIVLITK